MNNGGWARRQPALPLWIWCSALAPGSYGLHHPHHRRWGNPPSGCGSATYSELGPIPSTAHVLILLEIEHELHRLIPRTFLFYFIELPIASSAFMNIFAWVISAREEVVGLLSALVIARLDKRFVGLASAGLSRDTR